MVRQYVMMTSKDLVSQHVLYCSTLIRCFQSLIVLCQTNSKTQILDQELLKKESFEVNCVFQIVPQETSQ